MGRRISAFKIPKTTALAPIASPQAVTNIPNRIIDAVYSPLVTALLFALRERVHRAHGRIARLPGCQTLRDVFLNLSFQVILQLFIQILLHPLTPEKRS